MDDARVGTMWAAGIGCRRGCPAEAIRELLDRALVECGLAVDDLDRLASVDTRADEPGLIAVADTLGLSLSLWSVDVLRQFEGRLATRSDRVRALTGCYSVAEAAALAAVSAGDPCKGHCRLALDRRSNGRATVAIAWRHGDGVQ